MMRRIILCSGILVVFLLSGVNNANGQDFSVSGISPEMKKNADAVVRLSEESLEIKSISSAVYRCREVITILNNRALKYSVYSGSKGKLSTYSFDKIIIYDENGKKVKSYGSSNLKPYSPYSISIYDDENYYYVDPEYLRCPFTAEILYSVNFNGIFTLPGWQAHMGYQVSTEKSVFTVTAPSDYKLLFKQKNNAGDAVITDNGKSVTYRWEASNLPAVVDEPFSVTLDNYTPSVHLAPGTFKIEGFQGNSESWESFGMFRSELLKGRDYLEGTVVDSVKAIAAAQSDTTEMVRAIYKFMQNRTRYVSIQDGIGGWQPIEAMKTDKTKYGDCKGLVNYTKALLNVAGIKSIYTIVRAGEYEDDMETDFPSNQTNHIILCVPRGNDTIWLECTSQRAPFNYLGSFTDDRHVLLITDKGGKLVKTPKYSHSQNVQVRKATVTLDNLGNATSSVSTVYNNYFFDESMKYLYFDHDRQKKEVTSEIDIPGFTLLDFSFSQPVTDEPVINESLSLKLTKYANIMGDRILVPMNLMNKESRLPSNIAERKLDIEIKRDLSFIDSITYIIPSGYSAGTIPQPVEYDTPFGYYRAEISSDGKEITYIREMRYNKGLFPVTQYPQLVEFNKSVATADNIKITLKKL